MNTCNKCNKPCHCYGSTSELINNKQYCESCNCEKSKAQDLSFENNGGLVIDDTGECESCQ